MKGIVLLIYAWSFGLMVLAGSLAPAPPARASAPLPPDSLRAALARPGLADTARAPVPPAGPPADARRLARRYAAEGRAVARRARDVSAEMLLLNDMAAAAYYADDLLNAQTYFEALARGTRRTGQCTLLGHAYLGLGNVMGALDEEARARAYYEQARQIYASCTPPEITGQALILNNTGLNYLQTNQLDKAVRPVRQAMALIGRFQHPWLEQSLLNNLALLQRAQGHSDSAVQTLRQVVRLAHARDDQTIEGSALAHLGEIQLETDPAGARPLIEQSLRLARGTQDPGRVADGLRLYARVLHQLGQPGPAYDTLLRYQTLRDTLTRQELHEGIARQQIRFDVAQQKDRIRALEQQRRISRLKAERQEARTRTYGLVALSLLALVVVGSALIMLLVRSRRQLQTSEASLRQANATQDELMRIIGHDLRGPVAGFQQLTPLLHQVLADPDPADARLLVQSLDAGAQQLGGLVDNLFQWTRARSGQVVNRAVALPADVAVHSVGGLYEPVAQAKHIGLTYTAPPGLAVWADPDLLATVLRNLVGNALKFTPPGGQVGLRVAVAAPGFVEFSVTDTGPGLPPDQQTALFGRHPPPDRVVSTPGTRGEPGTGLGLPLSCRFVRLLGGELHAESAAGQGTRFWFRVAAGGGGGWTGT